ncbi:hypothetical protein SLS62_002872 [Diatrype stigma]|uniref:Adenine DNA glycosylase n=1 Tax=Diatrype stigma TaxID=117547 RepID=A0AAN9YUG7_9PEZI
MRRSSRIKQQPSLHFPKSPATSDSDEEAAIVQCSRSKPSRKRPRQASPSDASEIDAIDENDRADTPVPIVKRRKTVSSRKNNADSKTQLHTRLFGAATPDNNSALSSCRLPGRVHSVTYHRPLLLDSRQGRASLLKWFDSISTARAMPWRKPWFNPAAASNASEASMLQQQRQQLERRAYEVWISEIMLQQTRVAAVIEYWNRWMEKWPTIQDLAAAEPDEVLAAWRGLGYYSRATRIHEAAKLVTGDASMQGCLPAGVEALQAKVPGVGRYTAGAISAIVFGRAAPMVDGNVLRVLSRQLGLLGDVKTDKAAIDLLWAAADGLVKAVARDFPDGEEVERDAKSDDEPPVSDRPGRWGQALMELGSTVCTPKPNCAACPITSTCRAYAEGLQLSVKKGLAPKELAQASSDAAAIDVEDCCELCKPFDDESEPGEAEAKAEGAKRDKKLQVQKQGSLRSFVFTKNTKSSKSSQSPSCALSTTAVEGIANYARKFPVKTIKKAVRVEETLVCAIRRSGGRFLIHKRPEKGLLAGLWEFPSLILPSTNDSTPKTRKQDAAQHVSKLMGTSVSTRTNSQKSRLKHIGELGSVPWLFSHIKLTMHVHLFELDMADNVPDESALKATVQSRWSDAIDEESMGTGMRKCWALVKQAVEDD